LVPGLIFVDSHSRGDTSGPLLKPDVSVYAIQENKANDYKGIDRCIMSLLDIHIEFKWSTTEEPFVKHPTATSLVANTGNARDTLGQLSTYAAAQLAAQYRTHAFSIFVLRKKARIIRWDREGAIVTEPIEYDTDPSLVQFLSLYLMAPLQLRGIDTTVSVFTDPEAVSARIKLRLPAETPMFQTSVPSVDPGQPNLRIAFPFPEIIPSHPACRATRACSAYDIENDRVVFFKDSWRIDAPDTQLEGLIYEQLRAANVTNIPRCIAHGEVPHQAEQKTQTKASLVLSWACKEGEEVKIASHSHYRLVLDLVGKSLSTFTSTKELVQAIHDALLGRLLSIHDDQNLSPFHCPAHRGAFAAGILHRDLSVGNIVISEGRGYLIDWDLAKPTTVEQPRRVTRTVLITFAFTFTSLMNLSRALGSSYLSTS
jgi:Fungal protein kinase